MGLLAPRGKARGLVFGLHWTFLALGVAVPAVMLPHLVFFGPLEGVVTALVVSYVLASPGWSGQAGSGRPATDCAAPSIGRLWAATGVLAILTPLGLLAGGVAWGEWSAGELGQRVGFIPSGLEAMGRIWEGIVPDYGSGGATASLKYMLSALAGSAVFAAVFYVSGHVIEIKRGRLKR